MPTNPPRVINFEVGLVPSLIILSLHLFVKRLYNMYVSVPASRIGLYPNICVYVGLKFNPCSFLFEKVEIFFNFKAVGFNLSYRITDDDYAQSLLETLNSCALQIQTIDMSCVTAIFGSFCCGFVFGSLKL